MTYKTILDAVQALFPDAADAPDARAIHLVRAGAQPDWLTPGQLAWLEATGFEARRGSHAFLPANRAPEAVLAGLGDEDAGALFEGGLAAALPGGDYRLDAAPDDPALAAVAWALGHYAFDRYKEKQTRKPRRLVLPEGVNREEAASIAAANWLARDLINTPANDLGPDELEAAARDIAEHFGADCRVVAGDDLLTENFPLIHAVGRASPRAPRLIELTWGRKDAPKITLAGKGVCFDTGGLNIKTGDYMTLMKKDMGGSASALALAAMVMGAKLPVRLRLLIAAVENSVSGNSFRPGDILKSRAGHTVEIGNTDAEGRLVLADALSLADEDAPDHVFSFATLTGSARVALGPDLPPVYSTDAALAEALAKTGAEIGDPVWPMPLWAPYEAMLKSRLADIRNIGAGPFAGSILAALFLKRFVKSAKRFTHFDIYGWVAKAQPGKPAGGEPQAARAVFAWLKGAYPSA